MYNLKFNLKQHYGVYTMKKLSIEKLVETVHRLRKEKKLTQAQLAAATGINRAMIGRMENKDYVPTVEQLQALGETLGFEVVDLFVEDGEKKPSVRTAVEKRYNIAVAGTGYVGLSLATSTSPPWTSCRRRLT